jgi:hypothetical protein
MCLTKPPVSNSESPVKNVIALSVAWSSAAFSFAVDHWSALLSGLAAVAAFIASLYSIRINRIRLKREEIALNEEKQEVKIKHNPPPCDFP